MVLCESEKRGVVSLPGDRSQFKIVQCSLGRGDVLSVGVPAPTGVHRAPFTCREAEVGVAMAGVIMQATCFLLSSPKTAWHDGRAS